MGAAGHMDRTHESDVMAERKYTHGLKMTQVEGVTVIDIGSMEIWDGADLSLIRDTLFQLVVQEGKQAVGISMRHVQYVPSGFFGMLFDWLERGVEVRLYTPRPRIRQMLWFRKFFVPVTPGIYRLQDGETIDEEADENLWEAASAETPSPHPYYIAGSF
jgi:hypothetical protein